MKRLRAIGVRLGGVVKRPRVYFALALPIAVPLFLASVRVQPDAGSTADAAMLPSPSLRYEQLEAPFRADLPQHSMLLTMEEDDTLEQVLAAGGLSRSDSALLTRELAKSIDVRRLRPGHILRFHYDRQGTVDTVAMKVIGWGELSAVRNGSAFNVSAQPATIRNVETTVSATIDSSLYDAIHRAGERPQLAQQLIDIFQWDIDFFELRDGDSFSFVVTKQYAGSDLVGYGPITAAR
ncbi:MAG: hypothetical protein M3Q69_10330, partial [Acidobacteriota bacterium]|nr:hypothetical protein [Acidobacteriota bacterium]